MRLGRYLESFNTPQPLKNTLSQELVLEIGLPHPPSGLRTSIQTQEVV